MDECYQFLLNSLKENEIVVLGCSYGPDSMGLLSLLLEVRKRLHIKIICAHINHNIRLQSKKEQELLQKYCEQNNLIFEYMKITKYGEDNFHNEARIIRYNFYKSLIEKYNANYLMTAHHGDDLMETVLMRIVRGSTLRGYSGFEKVIPYENYTLIRPLIFVTKQKILDYDKKNKIPYAIDKSNFKDKYTRNRYRKYVLPFLKKEDKNVHEKFLKFSECLLEYDNFIKKQCLIEKNKIFIDNRLNISLFLKLDVVIQKEILFSIFEKIYEDDLFLINDSHIRLMFELINSKKHNSYIYLPNNMRATKNYDFIIIDKKIDDILSYDILFDTTVNLPNGKKIEQIVSSDNNSNYYCRLKFSDITLPLHIRTRQNGDRIMVKNLNGHKKVKDIFIDKKIPINERDQWPIVVDSKGEIVWIPGVKKTKYDVQKEKYCDIILWYH